MGPSWAVLGGPLGGAPWGRLGGASWAVLGRYSRLLGPSWGVGVPKGREGEQHRTTHWTISNFSRSGPSWKASLGPLGPYGRPLARVGAILSVWERSFGVSGPSWAVMGGGGAYCGLRGPSRCLLWPEKFTRETATSLGGHAASPRGHATRPTRIENLSAGHHKHPQDLGLRLRGRGR